MKKIVPVLMFLLTAAAITSAQDRQSAAEVQGVNPAPDICTVFALPVSKTNVTCNGGRNGNVILYTFGGTRPYTYSWSPAGVFSLPLDTIDIAGGLAAGTYTCLITDAAGCSYTAKVTITQPPKLTLATVSSSSVTCYGGSNGSASVVAGGGTPPYAYAWNPGGDTTVSASGLKAGTYIVTVTDTSRCSARDTIVITQAVPIAATFSMVPSACTGSNGMAIVTASNGISPYTYFWTPGGNSTSAATGLASGSYTCMITDSNSCSTSASVLVKDSTTLAVTLANSANVKCHGGNNGLAAFNVTGGKGPDTYQWLPSGGTGSFAAGLSAGTYTFTATDSVGCKAFSVITITQPNALHDTMSTVRNIACHGTSTGRLTVSVSGGTSPFTYLWSTNATTAGITGLTAGTYTVKITDSHGCLDSASYTLTQPATVLADSNQTTTIKCYGGTADITVYPYGGVPPYTYAWTPAGNTTNSATGVHAGTYIISIRDSATCRIRDTVTITQPPSFILGDDTVVSFPCSCKAWVQVSGSVSAYTFSWSPSGGTSDTASNLCAGRYVVTITDALGCVQTDTFNFNNTSGIYAYATESEIKIYPVPARSLVNVTVADNAFKPQRISIVDMVGREVVTQNVNSGSRNFSLDVADLPAGTYFLRLTGNGVKVVKMVVTGG